MKNLFTLLTLCSLGVFAVGCAPKDQGAEPAPGTPAAEGGSSVAPAASSETPAEPAAPPAGDTDTPPPATEPAPEGA